MVAVGAISKRIETLFTRGRVSLWRRDSNVYKNGIDLDSPGGDLYSGDSERSDDPDLALRIIQPSGDRSALFLDAFRPEGLDPASRCGADVLSPVVYIIPDRGTGIPLGV